MGERRQNTAGSHDDRESLRERVRTLERALRETEQRKPADDALRESEFWIRESQRVARIGSYVTDFQAGRWTSSEVLDEIFGIDKTFVRSVEGWAELVHPDDRQEMTRYLQDIIARRTPFDKNYRIIRRNDGAERWVYGRGELTFDPAGNPLTMVGTIQDITERRKAENDLRVSEERFRSVWDNSADGMRLTDGDGRIIDANEAFCRLVKMPRARLLGQVFSVTYKGHSEEDDLSVYRKRFEAGEIITRLSTRAMLWNGDLIHFEISSSFIQVAGQERMLLCLFRDVSERKRTEEALQDSEQQYRSLFENMLNGFAYCKMLYEDDRPYDFVYLSVNNAFEHLTGLKDAVGRKVSDVIPGIRESNPELFEIYGRVALTGNPERFETYVASLGIWFAIAVYSPAKEYFVAVFDNITERKKADEALRDSEEKYRALFEESKDVVYVSTVDGKILDINAAGLELFGYTSKEALKRLDLGRDLYVDQEQRDRFRGQMEEQGFVKDFESSLRRRDSEIVTVLETANAVRDQQGKVVIYRGIMRDVTKQRLLERQFIQAQKMESVGTLAGGIAHDFNNILSIIQGNASLLLDVGDENKKNGPRIDNIMRATERGANLVRQLLTFARKTQIERRAVQIHDLIQETIRLLEETFPKAIEVGLHLQSDSSLIMGDPTQLHQVMLNLCVNSRDAMPNGGTLTIQTMSVSGNSIRKKFPAARSGRYVQVSVNDTGTGMNEQTRKRIFDPFFTTKEGAKGTGLGLAVVMSIIEGHGGFIDVESEVGKGSKFRIFLPALEHGTEAVVRVGDQVAVAPGGTETILFVEDEPSLKSTLAECLQEKGYTVFAVGDGQEAMAVFEAHSQEISLVLTDLDLPKFDGESVSRSVKARKKEMPVVILTGFIEPERRGQLLELGVDEVILKPAKLGELLVRIRGILDRRRPEKP
jgi:PAS domain S-box-containing protein